MVITSFLPFHSWLWRFIEKAIALDELILLHDVQVCLLIARFVDDFRFDFFRTVKVLFFLVDVYFLWFCRTRLIVVLVLVCEAQV